MYDERNDQLVSEMIVYFDSTYKVLSNGELLSKSNALALCASLKPNSIIGEAGALFHDLAPNSPDIDRQSLQELYPDAVDLVDIALADFARGAAVPVDQVDLVYLRGTDAWKKHTPLRAIKN